MNARLRRGAAVAFGLALAAAAGGQEATVQLKEGPGKDKAGQCAVCHSLDYIPMNSRFLDKAGWTAEVNKMIKAYGAHIPAEDVDPIATYLADNYGKVPEMKPADKPQ